MDEIKIKIESLLDDMQLLANKVDSYSRHGRSPSINERIDQLNLLIEWKDLNSKKIMLEDLIVEYKINQQP